MDSLFPESYESSRARFLQDVELLRAKWPSSRLGTHLLKDHPDLSIDWFWAEPHEKENLVLVSTAEHGIEGYVGAAMLKIFMEEFAPRLNPENTGLLLLHAINPWGMKNNRKVNENSVDLNRNFIHDGSFDRTINPEFHRIEYLINPQTRLRSFGVETMLFGWRAIKALLMEGVAAITHASLLGQYHTPRGFYYGGTQPEEETLVAMDLYHTALAEYETVIQLDMHSGYGPRYQMSIIIPPVDPISSAAASAKFNYPLVQKINPEEFYAIHGDMGEYYYRLRDAEFPQKKLFACGFEFGTFGGSLLSRIRSLRAMVFENQLHWHGAVDETAAQAIREEFREAYFPSENRWREKAVADFRLATEGILKAYNLMK